MLQDTQLPQRPIPTIQAPFACRAGNRKGIINNNNNNNSNNSPTNNSTNNNSTTNNSFNHRGCSTRNWLPTSSIHHHPAAHRKRPLALAAAWLFQ